MLKRSGRPDFNQQVHAIFEKVAAGESCDDADRATESVAAQPAPPEREKDPAAVALGRKGGLKGGRARMDSLSPKERSKLGEEGGAGPVGEGQGQEGLTYGPRPQCGQVPGAGNRPASTSSTGTPAKRASLIAKLPLGRVPQATFSSDLRLKRVPLDAVRPTHAACARSAAPS